MNRVLRCGWKFIQASHNGVNQILNHIARDGNEPLDLNSRFRDQPLEPDADSP